MNGCLPRGHIKTPQAGDWAYTLVGGGCSHHCTTGLLPIVHLLDKPTNAGQLYFSILIILFPLLDHFQCSLFHISIKKCNQKAMEACFLFFFFKNNY